MTKLPIKVKLTRPIKDGDNEIAELALDETDVATEIDYQDLLAGFSDPPTAADSLRALNFWTARMAGISEDLAGKIKVSDQEAVQAATDQVFAHMGVKITDGKDDVPGKASAAAG